MEAPTLKDARALVERMKTIRPTCDQDEVVAFGEVASGRHTELTADNGWELSPTHAAFFKRCATCRDTFAYPWAGKLDAERVLAYMLAQKYAFDVAELEALL